jgi:folate-dependent tRNA-U54 methylase TrmFO/GidA
MFARKIGNLPIDVNPSDVRFEAVTRKPNDAHRTSQSSEVVCSRTTRSDDV